MEITRDMIKKLIKNINDAENSRPNHTVEDTIAAIDSVCAPDFEVRSNNGAYHDRKTERQFENWLFTRIIKLFTFRYLLYNIL